MRNLCIATVFCLLAARAGAVPAPADSVSSFALPGRDAPWPIADPIGIAVDSDHLLHVLDSSGWVVVLDRKGVPRTHYTVGEKARPDRILDGGDGTLLFLDTGSKEVRVVRSDGRPILSFGRSGSERGELGNPVDFARGPGGMIFILDLRHHSVQIFSADGLFIREVMVPYTCPKPTCLSIGADGSIFVADEGLSGQLCRLPAPVPWGWGSGNSTPEIAPTGFVWSRKVSAMAVNSKGTVAVLHGDGVSLWERRPGGVALGDTSGGSTRTGSAIAGPERPVAIAFDGPDQLLIVDAGRRSVWRVHLGSQGRLPDSPRAAAPIRVSYGEPPRLDSLLVALDSDSAGVRRMFFGSPKYTGQQITAVTAAAVGRHTAAGDSVVHFVPDAGSNSVWMAQIYSIGSVGTSESLLVVTDPVGKQFAVFNKRATNLLNVYRGGSSLPEMSSPEGIAVTETGRVVVSDPGSRCIFALNPQRDAISTFRMERKAWKLAPANEDEVVAWSETGEWFVVSAATGAVMQTNWTGFPFALRALTRDPFGNWLAMDLESQQIIIIDSSRKGALATFGPVHAYIDPTGLMADARGNVYVPDRGRMCTYVYNWSTWIDPPRQYRITYRESGASVQWVESFRPAPPEYEVRGRDASGAERALGRVRKPEWTFNAGEAGAFTPSRIRVAPVGFTGVPGEPGREVELAGLRASSAFRQGKADEAVKWSKAALAQIQEGSAGADSSTLALYGLILLLDDARRGDNESVISAWAGLRRTLPPRDREAAHRAVAESYLTTGRPAEARRTLLDLESAMGGSMPAADSGLIALSTRVFDATVSADTSAAIDFLERCDRWNASQPDSLRRPCRDRLRKFRTLSRFRQGFRYWNEMDVSSAVAFFNRVLDDPGAGLDLDQRITGRLVLCAAYFAASQSNRAQSEYKKILELRPGFDVDREVAEVERLYDLGLFNQKTIEALRRLGPAR